MGGRLSAPPSRGATTRNVDSEAWLVLRAQSGDREAVDLLLRGVERPLASYLRRLAGTELAADALQEAFLRIVRSLKHLRDPRYFRAWAFRVASREAWRALGQRRRRGEEAELEAETADPHSATDERLIARETRAEALRSLELLGPGVRAVIHLHFLEEMTLAEVADVLEIPVGTVKSRLGAGLARLRTRAVARSNASSEGEVAARNRSRGRSR